MLRSPDSLALSLGWVRMGLQSTEALDLDILVLVCWRMTLARAPSSCCWLDPWEAAEEVLVREMTEVEVSGPPSGVLSRRKRRLDPGLRIWST